MKVKTNVFFNGPHLEEELEEWLNEFHDMRIVTVLLTERPDEPQRVIARVVLEEIMIRLPCTLESCGHMRQLDAIVTFLGMQRGTRSVLDELRSRAELVADLEAEAQNAHQEVGALVSVLLEVHKGAVDPTMTDYAKLALVKTALSKCIETPEGKGTVVNLSKLVPFGKLEMTVKGVEVDLERSPQG